MSWICPDARRVVAHLKRLAGHRNADRHRPGYFRDYYAKNIVKLRAYYAAKKREYRSEQ